MSTDYRRCGAWPHLAPDGLGCVMPAGHNRGFADVPERHNFHLRAATPPATEQASPDPYQPRQAALHALLSLGDQQLTISEKLAYAQVCATLALVDQLDQITITETITITDDTDRDD